MNGPSDEDVRRLLQYCRKHAPEYLVDVYTAAVERKIALGLVVQHGAEVRLEADRPQYVILSDDADRALGPSGFNQATLVPLVKRCGAATVITMSPERWFYLDALTCALQRKTDVVVIETEPQQEAAWLRFLVKTNPDIVRGTWTQNSTRVAQ